MAKSKNEPVEQGKNVQVPNTANSSDTKKTSKKNELFFGLAAVLTAIVIVAAVFGGAFYAIIHNNVNGLGEKYRKDIQKIPVLKLALPKLPDPEDPKYLTEDEIKSKYNELRKKRDELANSLDEAAKKVQELQKVKDEVDSIKSESEKKQKDLESQLERLKKQAEQDKNTITQLQQQVAAKKEQQANQEAKQFSQYYESMDASAAAKIFEQLGDKKISLIVDIMKGMKKESTAEILAAMNPSFASKVTEKLSENYLKAGVQ